MNIRPIERIVLGQPTSDGAGVKLTRVLTQDLQRRLDPFLMLDAFRNENRDDYIGGFPDHPHRGFETVTYMLAGRMRHGDSAGNSGLLEGGGAQWMTAGRGLVHSEMPEQEEGRMEGFQLWVNLPAKNKMMAPVYRDLASAQIPQWTLEGGITLRMIAGRLALAGDSQQRVFEGAVQRPDTEPLYADLHFAQAGEIALNLPAKMNAFVYTYRGELKVGAPGQEKALPDTRMGILANAADLDTVRIRCDAPARCLLIAGLPLNEPIAQYGPFVMNTREELMKAFTDYQAGLIRA